jgi:hypothetical protein
MIKGMANQLTFEAVFEEKDFQESGTGFGFPDPGLLMNPDPDTSFA